MKKYKRENEFKESFKSVPKGFDIFLKKLAKMTDWNDHGGARVEIAKFFDLPRFGDIFEAINKCHKIEGGINYHLSQYREDVLKQLLVVIERVYGEEIANQINSEL